MEVDDRSTFTGCGWMRTDLNLVGAKFICYAVVYSFTQFSKDQCYNLGYGYLADWCGVDKRTIIRYIDEFVEQGLIKKVTTLFETTTLITTDYRVTKCHPTLSKNVTPSCDKMSPHILLYNNILNDILNTTSSLVRTQEKVIEWLTDDEEYLKSNIRTNKLIEHDPTSDELTKTISPYIRDFSVELLNQGVDIDIKGRLDTRKHFSNWLKKRVNYDRRLETSGHASVGGKDKVKKEYNLE